MSIKRQIQFKYRSLMHSLQTISLPSWITSKTARLVLCSIIVLFGTAYIVKMASSVTTGYKISELQQQTGSLQTDVQKLQVEIADNSSMNSISARLAKLNMVEASNVKYFSVKSATVARN